MLLLGTGFAVLLCSGFIYERICRRKYPPLGRLVDVGGRRLHLLVKGTDGPTVVIEQGAGGPSLGWLGVQDEIAKFARVCIYDRAGYQWSDPVTGPRSIEDRVEDLHNLLVYGNVPGPYVLVGHSYAGFLIRHFAQRYLSDVAGVVFVDAGHEHVYFQREVVSFYSKVTLLLRAMGALAIFGVPRLLSSVMPKSDLPQLNEGMVRRSYFAATSDDIASLSRAMPSLGSLGDLPVAVITHGLPFPGPFAVLEKGWREGQERLGALSTDSKFYLAEKSNHMIQNDQPELVIEAVRDVVMRSRLQDRLIQTDTTFVE